MHYKIPGAMCRQTVLARSATYAALSEVAQGAATRSGADYAMLSTEPLSRFNRCAAAPEQAWPLCRFRAPSQPKEIPMRLKTVWLVVMLALVILTAPLIAEAQTPAHLPRIGIIRGEPEDSPA